MKKFTLFFLIFASLFITSCSLFSSSKQQVKHYYQIHYKPQENSKQPIEATLRIKSFEADKIYKRYNMVYRSSFEEMFYYNTHFWATKPSDMITDLVANHFTKQQVFSDIIITMEKKPTYVVSGRILALDEVVDGEKSYARVAMLFELKDYKTDTTIVSHSFERQLEAKEQKPVAIVRAMGEIIESETDIFISKIYKNFASKKQQAEDE